MDQSIKSKDLSTSNHNGEVVKLQVSNKPITPELQKVIRKMGKPAKIELVNLLMSQIVDSDSSKLKIQSIQEFWDDFNAGKLTAVVWYQRLYLFFDKPYDDNKPDTTGVGSEWQQKIMASMIKGEPLPLFWINEKKVTMLHIIDGGHRTRTINAWFTNCIRLPANTIVNMEVNGNEVPLNLGGMNWFDIQKNYQQFAIEWANTYMIRSQVFDNVDDLEAAGLFFKLNDGNSMSASEDRNSIVSLLSGYVRNKADYSSNSAMKIFKKINLLHNDKTGKWSSKYHKIPLVKRGFDDFVSKVCYMVLKNFMVSVGNSKIKTWYEDEHQSEYGAKSFFKSTFETKVKSKFEKTLKWVDDLLMKETSKTGKLSPNEILLLLQIKNYFDSHFTFKVHDGTKLLQSYRKVLKYLKADAKLDSPKVKLKNRSDMITNITKILSSMSTASSEELVNWIPIIAKLMANLTHSKYRSAVKSGDKVEQQKHDGGYKLLDKNRTFSKSQKNSAEVEQDYECVYHYYCGNMVGEGHTSVGDHSGKVHSKYGETSDENLGVTCESCNTDKGSLSHDEFETIISMRINQ